jgi:hypothetical protein
VPHRIRQAKTYQCLCEVPGPLPRPLACLMYHGTIAESTGRHVSKAVPSTKRLVLSVRRAHSERYPYFVTCASVENQTPSRHQYHSGREPQLSHTTEYQHLNLFTCTMEPAQSICIRHCYQSCARTSTHRVSPFRFDSGAHHLESYCTAQHCDPTAVQHRPGKRFLHDVSRIPNYPDD